MFDVLSSDEDRCCVIARGVGENNPFSQTGKAWSLYSSVPVLFQIITPLVKVSSYTWLPNPPDTRWMFFTMMVDVFGLFLFIKQ